MAEERLWWATIGAAMWSPVAQAMVSGSKIPGMDITWRGCRRKSKPRDDRGRFLDLTIFFAGNDPRWGPTAHPVHGNDSGQALCRLWSIGRDQMGDLIRQAVGDPEFPVDVQELIAKPGHHSVTENVGAERLHDFEDAPVLLLHGNAQKPSTAIPPSPEFLYAMAMGIVQTFKLNVRGLRKYLEGIDGVSATYDGPTLNTLGRTVLEDQGLGK